MKKLLMLATGCTIVFAVACREVNQELINTVENGSAELKQVIPAADSLAKRSAQLLEQLAAAPTGIRAIPEYNFAEIEFKARAINDRSLEAIKICTEHSHNLDSLIQGYEDGNLKEETLKGAFSGLNEKIKGMPNVISRMQPIMAEITENYARVLEKWEALPDTEKKKAASDAASMTGEPTSIQGANPKPTVTEFAPKPKN